MDDNKLNFTEEQDEFFKSLVQKALKGEHMEKEFNRAASACLRRNFGAGVR